MQTQLSKVQIGKNFEEQACLWFLFQKNARLISKNYKCKWGELDLIFEEINSITQAVELVILEVRSINHSDPEIDVEAYCQLSFKKKLRLQRAVHHYLAKYKGRAESVRFDILFWIGTRWKYLENIWLQDS